MGADGTASAKAQECEAMWSFQNSNQIDIALCVRECMVQRVAGRQGGAVCKDPCLPY